MPTENYYRYSDDIDLDDQTMFEYVNQQNDVQEMISNVGPENLNTFGQAMEPFESSDKKKSIDNINDLDNKNFSGKNFEVVESYSKPKYLKWIIFILLILLAMYFLFRNKFFMCKNIKSYQTINEIAVNTIDTFTPTVQPEFRAIFVR